MKNHRLVAIIFGLLAGHLVLAVLADRYESRGLALLSGLLLGWAGGYFIGRPL